LTIALRQVGAAILEWGEELGRLLTNEVLDADLIERRPNVRVVVSVERVEIGAHGALEEDGVLWDDTNL